MKILNKIRGSALGYKIGRAILMNRFFANNFIYNYFYDRKKKAVMENLEKSAPSIEIGITNACNANCIMCPHHKLKKIGFMEMDLYKKIIDNCKDLGIKSVSLSFFGEALLDKNLIERVKYAKDLGICVGFFSNASLLTEKWVKDLINVGLDGITISLDGCSKETYEKIRRNLKFNVVKKNIQNLIKIKAKSGGETPRINLVFVELDENAHEIKQFYKEWEDKVDSINIINMRNWAGDIDKKSSRSFHFKKKSKRQPCSFLWQKMMIDWDGEVALCCDDWNHSCVLGNLKNQRIEEVWNGEKLKKIRELHLQGKYGKIPLCAKCNKETVWWLIN